MTVSLDQARALDALERGGTFAKAAELLRKGHTAVVYALRTLEEQTGLTLLDRSGYRARLTREGKEILEHCRRMLAAERALEDACAVIKTGWEPRLALVFDGIFPVEPIVRVVGAILRENAKTRVEVTTGFLGGVEREFHEREADVMISVLPAESSGLRAHPLPAIRALLVAHEQHPLARETEPVGQESLARHVLLTVRGSDPRLELSTSPLHALSTVRLNDFTAKKAAILGGLGYGWMPEHLVADELRQGTVRIIPWVKGNTHRFAPRLYVREGKLGRAAERVVAALVSPPRRVKSRA